MLASRTVTVIGRSPFDGGLTLPGLPSFLPIPSSFMFEKVSMVDPEGGVVDAGVPDATHCLCPLPLGQTFPDEQLSTALEHEVTAEDVVQVDPVYVTVWVP